MGHAKDNGGIWGHSSPIGANHYVIFAVGDDYVTNAALKGWLFGHGIGFKPLLGAYKGQTEQSYIVNYERLQHLFNIGVLAGQESILVLGPCNSKDERIATLAFLDPLGLNIIKTEKLGVFRSVSKDKAMAQDAWTYDPSTGEYYICVDPEAITLDPDGLAAANNVQMDCWRPSHEAITKVIKAYLKARKTI